MMWPWLSKLSCWFIKLVGGFLPIGTKPIGEWAGKLIWVVGIMMIFNFVSGLLNKPVANTSQHRIIALPFSHVGNITQSTDQKNTSPSRKWWMPIPYVSIAGQAVQQIEGDFETGAKAEAGLRLDF